MSISCAAISIGFSQSAYSVLEDDGVFQPGPVMIIKESSRVSEQVLTVNLDFIDTTATSGMYTVSCILQLV